MGSKTRRRATFTLGRRLVLLVDDNPVNLMAGSALLEILGYEVETAEDGLEAIASCQRRQPHVVLMDVNMPVLDGLQATMQLRKLQLDGILPPFPIHAFTADATPASRRACTRAGMNGFITKPLLISELEAELQRND
jgi:CheY-like chemotaxis protein